MTNWKFKDNYMHSGDYRIYDNYGHGSKRQVTSYSLYRGDEHLLTGSLDECKKKAEQLCN